MTDTPNAHFAETLAAPPPTERTPEVRGQRYERRALLGRGGMGEVHLCADTWIGREIALKVMRPETRSDGEGALARFVREAKVQARLEHPSIVPVYDIGRDQDGTVWFTMKRIRGRSLEDVLAKPDDADDFTRRKLLGAFVSVCYAVAFAHEQGVVHRDLKPGNIMLGEFGEVSVLDWGIAKIAGVPDAAPSSRELRDLAAGATAQGALVGTPGYMAPEQARGELEVGPIADVYALGAILYELLAGAPLHEGTNALALITAASKEKDARPSLRAKDVPPELDAIVVAATELDPAARIPNARELARKVEHYLDGDRDLERRKELAVEHLVVARAHLEKKNADSRVSALRELGRAIALDPNAPEALDLMGRTLVEIPEEVPPAAQQELSVERAMARKAAARAGAIRFVLWGVFVPFVFWMGVRDWAASLAIIGFMWASGVFAWWTSSRKMPGERSLFLLLLLSSLTIALISGLLGPFVVVPGLAATNAMYFAMALESRNRIWAIIASIAALALPFAAEIVGLVPRSFQFGANGFELVPRTLHLPEGATLTMLLFTSIATAIIPVVLVGRMRDALTSAEQRLFLQAWHLRAAIPGKRG